ncbi:MAG: diguanylate cyclase [Lachnospiraceae bacterium]|nr:diguanylate cyclase [Lachnospiraceae bacterium]
MMGYWIVVVDDEPLSLKNAKEHLNKKDMRVSCLRSGSDLLTFMEKNTPDLILLDILMPGMDGFETYRELRKLEEQMGRPQTPVIFLTGENDKETERRGLRAGASDYIHKPFDKDILINRIINTINNSRTIETLTEEATVDKLTGFLNKTSGTDKVTSVVKNSSGALIIFDLDNFKLVNDIFGHDMGDRVLVAFSEIIRFNVRSSDPVSRIGGDEFMAFFVDMTEEEAVSSLVSRLNEQLLAEAGKLMGSDHGIPLGISVGCAFAPSHADDYQILFQYADSALCRVKLNGKHGYEIYDPSVHEGDVKGDDDDLGRDLSRVIRIVSERGEGKGAMLLGQEAFSWNYRFIIRFLKRYGGIGNRILFRISAREEGVIFSEIVAQFGNVLKNSLRKSDIIFQCRPNQFFVVLPQLTQRDTPGVIRRVMKAWEMSGYNDRTQIEYTSSDLSFATEDNE